MLPTQDLVYRRIQNQFEVFDFDLDDVQTIDVRMALKDFMNPADEDFELAAFDIWAAIRLRSFRKLYSYRNLGSHTRRG